MNRPLSAVTLCLAFLPLLLPESHSSISLAQSTAAECQDGAGPVVYVATRRRRRNYVPQQPAPAAVQGEPTPAPLPATAAKPKEMEWKSLFDGKELGKWKSTDFGGQGEVKVEKGELILEMGEPLTGVTWQKKDELPTDNFEITLEAMKVKGDDFFCGLTFPVRKSYCSLICGGWGGGVVGISSINNFDASENETTKYQEFKKDKWYKIRVRVADDKIQAWIDDDQLVDVELGDKKISTRFEVDISQPLGISAYRTKAALRNIKIRKVEPGEKAETTDKKEKK